MASKCLSPIEKPPAVRREVFALKISEFPHLEEAIPHLSPYRRQRVEQTKHPEERRRRLGAGVALDYALSTLGLREKAMKIGLTEHKKPYFTDHPHICFNLSHSGDWAVCALSDGYVGVDVQEPRPISQALRRGALAPHEEPANDWDFFRVWCAKESYIKAYGIGMDMRGLEVELSLPGVRPVLGHRGFERVREYALPGAAMAVCPGEGFDGTLTFVPPDWSYQYK